MKKIAFLFGAGAEAKGNFNISNGNEFLLKTIYSENRFYKKIVTEKFNIHLKNLIGLSSAKISEKYIKEFMCQYILLLTNRKFKGKYCYSINNELADLIGLKDFIADNDILLKEFNKRKVYSNEFSDDMIKIYTDLKKCNNTYKDLYNALNNSKCKNKLKKLLFNNDKLNDEIIKKAYQTTKIENRLDRMFYNLIDPNKYSIKEYYQVFYYYWKCFLTIIDDIYLIDNNKSKPKLNSLDDYINYSKLINNNEYLINFNYTNTYYENIKNCFCKNEKCQIKAFVTTNYTNLINYLDKYSKIYNIHGNLDIFESSKKMTFINCKKLLKTKEEYFPFIMGMSNLKPIINYKQIGILHNAFRKIYLADCLIIIGYGINDNDNHLTSMIKEFVEKRNKKLIYVTKNSTLNDLETKLRIKDSKNIKIIDVKNIKSNKDVIKKIIELL